jgi:dipeptidyl aminopeptidase/acylaminoacyl peptidase
MMAAELSRNGVEQRLIRVRGGEHGLADAKPADIDDAYKEAISFLRQHLGVR